jgi:hypothetical protein
MSIRRHLFGSMATDRDCLSEKALGCLHVSRLAQKRIHQVAVMINGPIQRAPFPANFDRRLINIPGFSCLSVPSRSQLVCKQRGKACFPIPNGLMRKDKAAFVAPSQPHHAGESSVTQSPQNNQQDDVSGSFKIIEWGSGSFIEGALVYETKEGCVAKLCFRGFTL